MRRHPTLHRRDHGGAGGFQPSLTEVGEAFGVLLATRDGLDHRASAYAHHVADDAGELQVGVLKDLLDTQRVLRDFSDQLLPGAGQVAQFMNRRRRDKAAPNETVREQVCNPHGIVHVGLAARYAADLQGVGEDEVKLPVQHVADRLPVNAGRLHGDMGARVRRQPIGQRQQIARSRAESADILLHRRTGRDACAGDDGLLMHVQSGAARIQNFHRDLLVVSARSPRHRSLEGVLSGRDRWQQSGVLAGLRVRLIFGLRAPLINRPLC